MRTQKSITQVYIYAIAFLPIIILLGTGVVMLNYHTGTHKDSLIIGLNGYDWFSFHKVMCVISTPLILLHLFVKTNWVKDLLTFNVKGRFKIPNILLFVLFLACLLTSTFSWLVFNRTEIADMLRGIHNKLGILLIILFIMHLINYSKTIIVRTKQIIKKTTQSNL